LVALEIFFKRANFINLLHPIIVISIYKMNFVHLNPPRFGEKIAFGLFHLIFQQNYLPNVK